MNLSVMMVNDDEVDSGIISHVPKFKDFYGSNFVISNDWTLSHRLMLGVFKLVVKQTFNSKNDLVNTIKQYHIAYSVEYWVKSQTLNLLNHNACKHLDIWGSHKRFSSLDITKLKGLHMCFYLYKKNQLDANLNANALSTLVMNKFFMIVITI